MTEEYKNIITLVIEQFVGAVKSVVNSVKDVREELDEADETDTFTKAATDTKKLTEELKNAQKAAYQTNGGFRDLKNGLKDTGMAAKSLMAQLGKFLSLAAIVAGIKAAISAGASAMAEEAQFAQVFGGMTFTAKKALNEIAKETGFTAEAMRSSFSSIASFAKVSGMNTADALDLTKRAMTAAADSAAFYDRELSDVVENMRSYLKGNFENDAALGLSSTETTRNAMAMQLYGKAFKDLTEQQKQLTLLSQIEQANRLSGAIGQAARESANWSTNLQRLKSLFTSLISVLGRGFIAVLNPVLTVLNSIMSALVAFANGVAEVFSSLFGTDQLSMTLTEPLEDVSASTADVSDGIDGVGEAAKGAAKEAKELTRQLMGFDKINKLNSNSSKGNSDAGGGSGGGSGIGAAGGSAAAANSMLDDVLEKTDEFSERMKQFSDFLAGLDFDPLRKSWESLREAAGRLGGIIQDLLYWGLVNVLEPMAKWTIEAVVPKNIQVLADVLQVLADVMVILQKPATWVFDNVLTPLANVAANTYTEALDALHESLTDLHEILQDIIDVLDGKKTLGDVIRKWLTIPSMADFLGDLTQLLEKLNKLQAFARTPVTIGVELAKHGWKTVVAWVDEKMGGKISASVGLVKKGWSSVKSWALGAAGGVFSVGIKLVKSGWSTVKKWLGDLTAKFNLKLPKVTVEWSGTPIKLPHFNIKWNAKGGILNGATLFGMTGNTLLGGGEAGREAVLPLDSNTDWMDTLAGKVGQQIGTGNQQSSQQPIVVQVKLDGRVVGQSTVNYINRQRRMTGKSPILL